MTDAGRQLVTKRTGLRTDETLQRVDEGDLELVNRRRIPPHLRVSGRQGLGGLRALGGGALHRRLRGGTRGRNKDERWDEDAEQNESSAS